MVNKRQALIHGVHIETSGDSDEVAQEAVRLCTTMCVLCPMGDPSWDRPWGGSTNSRYRFCEIEGYQGPRRVVVGLRSLTLPPRYTETVRNALGLLSRMAARSRPCGAWQSAAKDVLDVSKRGRGEPTGGIASRSGFTPCVVVVVGSRGDPLLPRASGCRPRGPDPALWIHPDCD
jgi:hypothetical protein